MASPREAKSVAELVVKKIAVITGFSSTAKAGLRVAAAFARHTGPAFY